MWSIVLIAWLTLHWGILPHIDEWRPQLEERASQSLGLPVRIGQISVQSPGWVPALELRDVVLADRDGRQALRLPRISAALSVKSLFALRLVFSQLYIEGPEIEVRRDAQGRLHVAGLDMDGSARLDSAGEGGGALDWLLDQPEFVLRHGTLRWVDQQRAAPPLELHDADLVLRNGLRRHEIRLDATPGAGLGDRFMLAGHFNQPLLARSGDWARWSGTVYVDLPAADLARVREHVTLPFDLQAGSGAARLWLDVAKGQWRRATLDAALDGVQIKLGPSLEPVALDRLQGRFETERSAGTLRVAAQQFAFATADGASWPASRFSLVLNQRQRLDRVTLSDEPVSGGEFSADRLDLGLMAAVAGRLPLPDNVRQGLAELAPSGVVQPLQASWVGPPEQPVHYRVKGRVGQLSIAAAPAPEAEHVGRPGWHGADLEIDASETGGEARLAVKDGALELPGVFEDPLLPVDHFSSQLVWQIQPQRPAPGAKGPAEPLPPAIDLRVIDARFANADARGDLQLHWHTGAGTGRGKGGRYPGVIEVSGQIEQGQAARVARYLPLGVAASARAYVSGAVQSGTVRHAKLRLRGDLNEFPFAHAGTNARDSDFHVSAQAENLSFAYVPPVLTEGTLRWPVFTQLYGELVFDRGAMHIKDARAKLGGIELKGVNGGIADLMHEPTLAIEGGGRGPLADMLRYVAATPVDGWLSHALHDATGTGPAELQLALRIPLNDAEHTTVKGSVTLAGNDVRIRPDVPALTAARSRIDFTQRGFAIGPGSARSLGGELSFEGGMAADGVVRVSAQGTASADGLRQARELGLLVPHLASAMTGQAAYKLQLGVQAGHTELQITSPLTGIALDLPPPFRKPAEASWPLRIQTRLLPTEAGAEPGPARDQLHIELGSVLQADYQRELVADGARVLRGALALGEAPLPPMPAIGNVSAAVQTPQLHADAWLARWRTASPEAPAAGDPRAARGGESAGRAPDVAGYLPTDVALRTGALVLGGRRFGSLNASVQRRGSGDSEVWHAALQGDAAQGQVDWRPAGAAAPWPRVQARLLRLTVPAAEGEPPPPAAPDPSADLLRPAGTLPAIDLVIDEFEWRGRKFGRLEIDGRPADGPAPRDWRLAKLALTSPDARLAATGTWAAAKGRMAMDARLDVADAGATLERAGLGKQLRGGKGRVQGQFSWTGSPLLPDWPTLAGNAQLNLDAGQFLKAEPGAARLLGVLSLQALPRRLTLDFRDVFQQGFAFDNFAGDVAFEQGIARSNNLRIRGVQAAVLIEGQADLKRETQDLHMVVVPEINAGTASLAYAAINPAIGLGTFLAQLFLRKPLMQAGTREFRVTGSWSDPQVDTVERRGDAPLPDFDSAAASAPMPAR
ncbi:YhdP family protein [Ideonella sp.]|uniref:YhdP family protein n=1 Tax=Ideonella sp. TaxID=1929293 RepID=UPI0039C8910D